MHAVTINEKRGHGFKGEGGEVYGRAWMEERKCKMLKLCYNFKNSNKQNICFGPTV